MYVIEGVMTLEENVDDTFIEPYDIDSDKSFFSFDITSTHNMNRGKG